MLTQYDSSGIKTKQICLFELSNIIFHPSRTFDLWLQIYSPGQTNVILQLSYWMGPIGTSIGQVKLLCCLTVEVDFSSVSRKEDLVFNLP